jgi:hypothetical protein
LSDKMQEWLEFQWKFISDKENSWFGSTLWLYVFTGSCKMYI